MDFFPKNGLIVFRGRERERDRAREIEGQRGKQSNRSRQPWVFTLIQESRSCEEKNTTIRRGSFS